MEKIPYEKIDLFLKELFKKEPTIDIHVFHEKEFTTIIWNDGSKTVIKDCDNRN